MTESLSQSAGRVALVGAGPGDPGLLTLHALRALEAAAAGYGFPDELQGRLTELAEMNHANGILLARRRREVNWALRHLGRTESSGAYDAQGQTSTLSAPRPLAVA